MFRHCTLTMFTSFPVVIYIVIFKKWIYATELDKKLETNITIIKKYIAYFNKKVLINTNFHSRF